MNTRKGAAAVVAVALVIGAAGCGSHAKNNDAAARITLAQASNTTATTLAPTTTTAAMSTSAIESQVRAFYIAYANLALNQRSGSDNTYFKAQNTLEAKYLDSSLLEQIDQERSSIDYDPIECAQNVTTDITVKVSRISNGTFDATVTAGYAGSPQDDEVFPISGASDTGVLHTIKCPSGM